MGEFSTTILSILRREAPDQGGLLTGKDPSAFNTSDPIRLWIIQVGVIVGMASFLSLGLRKIRQPKVIAEVLGGILLGPTAFGRIPGFTEHVFPSDSIPYLSLVANIGLCLFLFLVGLEIDMSIIRRNAKLSGTVALAGMVIPFGAGVGLSKPLYNQFINTPDSGLTGFVKFTYFMLFTGVAYSITAFPVLCRILTELKLLDTTVGVVVLSAGVANDIIGWTLLALSVALVNAGSGLTALYILLVCVGWALILLFPGKMALQWLGRKTGSTEGHGPSMFFMTVTMLLLFGSAFFTDVIGVHAIFGAFLTGIIVPREGNLPIYLTEKLEDMVSIIFLPLYFTLSGLSTNLGLLDNGITWGYTIAICALAFTGKFGGCCLAAHYVAKFNWRESGTIGSLMSCKGLVELIVLNVGLSAGILSQRVFSMFVLEALLLTFMTTPLVTLLYPPEARIRVAAAGANFNNVADRNNMLEPGSKLDIEDRKGSSSDESSDGEERMMKTRFTVVLDRIEHLPGMMALTQMIKPSLVSLQSSLLPVAPSQPIPDLQQVTPASEISGGATLVSPTPVTIPTIALPSSQPLKAIDHHISALRLVELSDRTSAVMKSMSIAAHPDHATVLAQCDPMLSIYTTFASLNDLSVTPALETVPFDDLARAVVDFARDAGYSTYSSSGRPGGEMLLLPWLPPTVGQPHGLESHPVSPAPSTAVHNPFDTLFNKGSGMGGASTPVPGSHAIHSMGDKLSNSVAATIHSQFVRQVFSKATVDVGLFMDLGCKQAAAAAASTGLLGISKPSSFGGVDHILLPFFGGPDDRLALAFVVQLCENEKVTATCLKITKTEELNAEGPALVPNAHLNPDDAKYVVPPETLLTVASAFSARSAAGFPDTVYGHANTATRMQSETADHLAWARFANATELASSSSSTGSTSGAFPSRAALSRIHFQDLSSPVPLHKVIAEANHIRSSHNSGKTKLLVVTGRSRRLAVENHAKEIKRLMEEQHSHGLGVDVRKTIGDVASSIVMSGCAEEILVVQAADIDS
ncbi:MAG: Sodium/hydrogen exchanger family-domain-containing protein [Lentinula lateritia]|nr:MAG: Sodium/hydrogen exchanger family-domain-containing protein [Lentinula lateritia]